MILIFPFFILLIEVLIVGLLFSKLIINIETLDIEFKEKNICIESLNVSLEIKLFKIIKVLKIKIYKEYFKVFGIKFYYNKFKKEKIYIILKEFLSNKLSRSKIKKLKCNLENFNFYLNLGTENVIFTSSLIVIISNIISIFLAKSIRKFNSKKYNFKVVPNYLNVNNFKLSLKSKLNINTFSLIK